MSDRLQDATKLPVPETKGRKGLWIAIAVIGIFFLIIVGIKAGTATKDPKKAVVDAAGDDRSATGTKTSESVQGMADQMVDPSGAIHEQSSSVYNFLDKNIEHNRELAEEQKFANSSRRRTSYEGELPSSIDAHGHPVAATRDHYTSGTTTTEEKSFVIPKSAEGWDPEQEIIVSATNQTPAYRYRPAYLKGSNNPHRSGDLEQLDNVWLNSISMPSYGHSLQVNAAFNADLAPVAIKQSVHNNELIYLNGYKGTKQQARQIVISSSNNKRWTIPAPGEHK
jgi:hypothetical protein